ncbi:hypothetical protein DEO72_LG2g3084 [Vigna unguiculata]|uniref:Uncharacterized protein n=1 Tax=Vigna unguiculata TaxID=3917 RepID=A0A4D6L2M6_VIGUN|nr:hypothetical protein DEO72_LG2g3084 [Vigna unguiculata]
MAAAAAITFSGHHRSHSSHGASSSSSCLSHGSPFHRQLAGICTITPLRRTTAKRRHLLRTTNSNAPSSPWQQRTRASITPPPSPSSLEQNATVPPPSSSIKARVRLLRSHCSSTLRRNLHHFRSAREPELHRSSAHHHREPSPQRIRQREQRAASRYCFVTIASRQARRRRSRSSRRQPRSQGEECESETLILERESALPRVSI